MIAFDYGMLPALGFIALGVLGLILIGINWLIGRMLP